MFLKVAILVSIETDAFTSTESNVRSTHLFYALKAFTQDFVSPPGDLNIYGVWNQLKGEIWTMWIKQIVFLFHYYTYKFNCAQKMSATNSCNLALTYNLLLSFVHKLLEFMVTPTWLPKEL